MKTLLIANRGEIARRIMHTGRRMGLRTVAVYSDADRDAPHVREADAAVRLGAAAPRESYLNIAAIIAAAKRAGADSVHPGYGFLAENADFAQAVIDAGLTWVGPPPTAIRQMGDKANAKRIARAAGVPTIPGIELDADGVAASSVLDIHVDYPVMIKAAAGGGGRGIRLVREPAELGAAVESARSEAQHAFGDGRLLIEHAVSQARHIEVQVFADAHGNVVHLGERDCSVQRRHQKLIEESPSPAVDAALREQLGAAAVALARAVSYVGAGTVEFLLGADNQFYFMEMNTRLQVEHPVTEGVTGTDLAVARRHGRTLHATAMRYPFLRPRDRGTAVRRGPGGQFPAAGRAHRAVASRRLRPHRPCAGIRCGDFSALRLDDRESHRARRDTR